MNKSEFLHILQMSLKDFKDEEKKEILYDYEEHFRIGEESGKSEDELITELGNPNSIANQYKSTNQQDNIEIIKVKPKENTPLIVSLIAACSLILFNLIFILGPLAGIIATIIGLFISAIAIIISGIAVIFSIILSPVFPQYINIPDGFSSFAVIFFGIGTIALGLLFLIGMYYVGKYFYKGIAKYINWNVRIIKGRC